MKKNYFFLLLAIGINTVIHAQTTWNYNFGTGATQDPFAGTAPNNNVSSNSTSTTAGYLPTTAANGGSAYIRKGTNGGYFQLINPGFSGGTDTELKGVAATGTSYNKFSINGFDGATTAAIAFRVRLDVGSGTNGEWQFYAGNNSSGNYSNGSAIASTDVFAGIRWQYNSSGITTYRYPAGGSWTTGSITATPFAQKTNYIVEVYINNSNANTSYLRKSATQNLDKQTYDVWVNNTKIITGQTKSDLTAEAIINSFGFVGISSTGNAATIYLDDFQYSNYLTESTLPVSLTSFNAKANLQNIDLAWNTASEKNNSHFEILRSGDDKSFAKIGEVKGNGTTDLSNNYTFIDKEALPGINYYQLKQVDNNGDFTLSDIVAVKSNVKASNLYVIANKEEGIVKLRIYAANKGKANFKIYDLNGRKLTDKELALNKGYTDLSVPFQGANGLYFASLATDKEVVAQKFIK